MNSLAFDYINNSGLRIIKLNKRSKRYLNGLYKKILLNNELLLNSKVVPKFYVIIENHPFYSSLPGGHFFFSLGLITKYFKYENLLVAALTSEIIKVHRDLYKKRIIVPIGHIRTERILALNRIPLDVKTELNKWTFYAMRRTGFDSFSCLIWLQIQNKNALDFTLQLGDSKNISQEEFLFKNFIIKEGSGERDNKRAESNSSKSFYRFINFIKRVKI